jgi:hypothetical protein
MASATLAAPVGLSSLTFSDVLPQTRPPAADSDVVACLEFTGGLCRDAGERTGGHVCVAVLQIRRDGTKSWSSDVSAARSGAISGQELDSLLTAIEKADFQEARSHGPGNCESAHDGQDATFYFYASHGIERVADCETRVDWKVTPFSNVGAIY